MSGAISVLGLGKMGSALAAAFIAGKYKTTVWNRTPGKAQPLVEKGASLASSAAACVEASKLVILCLLDKDSVHEALQGIPAQSLQGRTLVNCTSQSPDGARETAEFARSLDSTGTVKYLQGAILGSPPMVGLPDCVVMYSGDEAVFQSVESDLAVLGAKNFLGAEVGMAPLYDTALLSSMYGALAGFLHANAVIRVATKGQRSAEEFTTQMLVPFFNIIGGLLSHIAGQIDSGDYTATDAALGMQLVGLDNIIRSGEEIGVVRDMLQPVRDLIAKKVETGGASDGVAALMDPLIREPHKK